MHALVTGGGGFLGRYIVEQLLARGDRVRSFGRGAYPELEAMGVEVRRGDMADILAVGVACEGIDCVFHTAARAGIGGKFAEFARTNIKGTRRLLIACHVNRVPRLVFTSSPSVVFAGLDQSGVNERQAYHPELLKQNAAYY